MSRLGSLYIRLGEPEGEMPGCCETADWAAGYIEELQTELNEQARLLGMSAERELKLIAERDQFRDGMLTLGTELRTIEAALDDERINLTHTAAQVAAEMRGKINELHAEIERLRAEIAASVPAPIEGAKYMSNDWYYAEGWNDCRHAMLDAQENNDGRN